MLVDTDVLIWYLRGHEKAAWYLESLREPKLSAVTWRELVQGCRNRQELERLKKDLSQRQAVTLPITESISERAMALVERISWATAYFSPMPSLPPPPSSTPSHSAAPTQTFQADPGIGITGV